MKKVTLCLLIMAMWRLRRAVNRADALTKHRKEVEARKAAYLKWIRDMELQSRPKAKPRPDPLAGVRKELAELRQVVMMGNLVRA